MTDRPTETQEPDAAAAWRKAQEEYMKLLMAREKEAQEALDASRVKFLALQRDRAAARRDVRRARRKAEAEAKAAGVSLDIPAQPWADGTTDSTKGAGGSEEGGEQ